MKKRIISVLLCGILLGITACSFNEKREEIAIGIEKETTVVEENDKILEESESLEVPDKSIKFDFGDDGEIAVMIDRESSIEVYVHSKDAEECSLAFAYYYSSLSDDKMKDCNTSILVNYTDGLSVLWNKTEVGESIIGINSDGSSTSKLPDWIITDMSQFSLSETEQEDILLELQEHTLEFLK